MAPDPREGAPWRGALALGVGQSRSKVTCRTHPHFSLLRLSELLAGLPLEKPAGGRMQGGRMARRPEGHPPAHPPWTLPWE